MTLLITHPAFVRHAPPEGHPERPDRIRVVEKVLAHELFSGLPHEEAPLGADEAIARAHPESYIRRIVTSEPEPGEAARPLDPDTWMSHGSVEVGRRAVGAGVRGVDAVMKGEAGNVFCAVRPPGHHAERERAMGFCLFSSIAIAGLHARAVHGAERIAVVDFDVHHGNGTQDVFWADRDLFYASTHQMPLYPGTGSPAERGVGNNILNVPLRPGDGGREFRAAMKESVLPALKNFRPDILLVSTGFDAHRDDPLASLEFTEEDFVWATLVLMEAADRHCGGRLVSMLEGGYDLGALARSTAMHVQALVRGTGEVEAPDLEEADDER
ncbi:MAG: histone deacetylase family protein [Parvibaculaceae bacterium]